MSWLIKVSDAILAGKTDTEVNALMGAAVDSIGSRLQALISEIDPEDYALLTAMLRVTLRSLTDHLPSDELSLSFAIEKKIQSVTIVLPQRREDGR